MKNMADKWAYLTAIPLIIGLLITPAMADEYPGVHTNDNTLVFVQSSDELGGLHGIVVLSYEFSMDWVITTANIGAITETGIILTDGYQYVYNADGTRRSEVNFTSYDMAFQWDEMDFNLLPSYGNFLAPMVHGGLAYALVETRSGLPAQLILGREVIDNGATLNVFEGYLYQLSEGQLTAQIAFTEMAFGSQGLVMGDFPEDFPPPPEDYPDPYPDYTMPGYPSPVDNTLPSNPTNNMIDNQFNPSMPMGTEVPPDEVSDQPRFNLEPMHDYDIPPLMTIGVVQTRSFIEEEGFDVVCDEIIMDRLGDIEGITPVLIEYDSSLFGGAVMYDRATWLCTEYGVDALMMSELVWLEAPGGIGSTRIASTFRVNTRFRSKIIEGTGGSEVWEGDFESERYHDSYEVSTSLDPAYTADLNLLLMGMINDVISQQVLEGGHVD